MYGGAATDQYVIRRQASDGTLSTLLRLPSTGVRNDYTSFDIHVDGGSARAAYTAAECGSPACTFGVPRIHFVATPL